MFTIKFMFLAVFQFISLNSQLLSSEGISQFGFQLFDEFCDEKNCIFSPYSIYTALAMLERGSRGETKRQIQQILQFNLNSSEINPNQEKFEINFEKQFKRIKLQSANAIFVDSNFDLLNDYQNLIEEQFSGEVNDLEFVKNPFESWKKINQFVEEKTDCEIRDLIPQDSINSDTRVVLINALYFKGFWSTVFDKDSTKVQEFKISPTETTFVPMMYTSGAFKHGEVEGYPGVSFIEIPYKGGKMSMFVLIPKSLSEMSYFKGQKNQQLGPLSIITEFLQDYPDFIETLQSSAIEKVVHLYLPKFTLEFKTELSDTLIDMGVVDAFTPGVADFGEMVENSDNNELYLSQGFHQAKIVVNEEGTKAAAATGLVMLRRSAGLIEQQLFVVDQPFVFIIMHKPTGVVYFTGQVSDPSLSS